MAAGTPQTLGTQANVGNVSNVTLAITNAIQAGDLVFALIYSLTDNTPNLVTSVSDGANTYTKATDDHATANYFAELWYCQNATARSAGTNLVASLSLATGNAADSVSILAGRVANVVTSSSLDKTGATNTTGGTSLSIATGTLAQAAEIVIGCRALGFGAGSSSTPSGFTNLNSIDNSGTSNGRAYLDYQIVSATTTVTNSFSWTTSARGVGLVASFKAISAFSLTAAAGSYSLTGFASLVQKTKYFVAAAGSYAVTGGAIVIARRIGRTAIRRSQYVLQAIRSTGQALRNLRSRPPTLGE